MSRATTASKLNAKFTDTKRESEAKFAVRNKNFLAWSVSFRQQLQDEFALGRGGEADTRGSGGRADGAHPKHVKKDLAFWKLADMIW